MSDKIKILAIESSCDETAAAVVENYMEELSQRLPQENMWRK